MHHEKMVALILCLCMVLSLCGCKESKDPDDLILENILLVSEYQLEKALLGINRQQIHDLWGTPVGYLMDPPGEVFQIPYSEKMIIVLYDSNNMVTAVKIKPKP